MLPLSGRELAAIKSNMDSKNVHRVYVGTARMSTGMSYGQMGSLWQCVEGLEGLKGLDGAWSAYHLPPELGGAHCDFAVSLPLWEYELWSTL